MEVVGVKRGEGEKEPRGAGEGRGGALHKKRLQDRGLKVGRVRGGVKTQFKNSRV